MQLCVNFPVCRTIKGPESTDCLQGSGCTKHTHKEAVNKFLWTLADCV